MNYNFETFEDRRDKGSAKYALMNMQNSHTDDDIVPMSVADMEFNVAPEIISGLQDYIEDSILGYEIVTDDYKNSVVSWFKRRYNTEIKADWISTSSGVVDGFYAGVLAFTKIGEGVVVMPPTYGPFFSAVESTSRELIECPLLEKDNKHFIDFDKFEELAKNEKTKLLLFCNPLNPSGRAWSKEELNRIGEICLENDLKIVSDEIHSDFIRPGYEFTSFLNVSEDILDITCICHAPNKTFNIAGLQAGNNIIANEELKEKFDEIAGIYKLSGSNSLAMKATELAYNEAEKWLDELLIVIDENIKYFIDRIKNDLPEIRIFEPEATYLLWMDMSGLGMEDEELEDFLTQKAQLFLSNGSFFREKKPCYRRINLACPKWVVEDAVDRLIDAIKEK